ncbi:hypothetical protein F4803DRAFT_545106 [Xylaria telfairii]|nr:hypothetical protein F4803DRAFT_545106 [Xylaria telfairii]
MSPVQNIFSVIPDLPSALNGNRHCADPSDVRARRPPMTTKQVRKAYQKANKGPRLSKAEQRRQELFEQDRIRKEFEKEKNQARARAARDKKREREERERIEKRKKGLPLVDVRPSQDTIARFVRPKPRSQRDGGASPPRRHAPRPRSASPTVHNSGEPRPVDNVDEENVRHPQKRSHAVPKGTSHDLRGTSPIPDHTEPVDKKRKVEGDEDQTPPPIVDRVVSSPPGHHPTASVAGDRVHGTPSSRVKQGEPNLDDSFLTIDLSEENLFDNLLREMDDVSTSSNALITSSPGPQQDHQNIPTQPPENPVPPQKQTGRTPVCLERAAEPTDSIPPRRSVLSPSLVSSTVKTPCQGPIPTPRRQELTPLSFAAPPTSSTKRSPPKTLVSRAFRHHRTTVAPAPAPPKFKPYKQVAASLPSTPQFIKPPLPPPRTAAKGSYHSRAIQPRQVQHNELPPSTQLFLISHLDDFLPSPSQEVREIFEGPQVDHAANVVKVELTATLSADEDPKPSQFMSRMPTASSNTCVASMPRINPRVFHQLQHVSDHPIPSKAKIRNHPQAISQHVPSAFEMPPFSTQDLLLSSQDVKDIEGPLSSTRAQNLTPLPTEDCIKPSNAPRRSPKPFLTSTCRELRYKYVLERGRTAAWEGPSAQQKAREEFDRLQELEDEQLERLLANPNEGTEEGNGNTGAIAVEVEFNAVGKESFTTPSRGTPTPQVQSRRGWTGRGPCSITEDTAQKHTRTLPNGQRLKLGTSGSSYEAMLELLAKGPKKDKDTHLMNRNVDRDKDKDRSRYNNSDRMKAVEGITSPPASQETDYDCGEEWDDDDLFHGML